MMQSTRDALVDALLESGSDDAVHAVVPALLAGRTNIHVSLCRRLLRRGAPLIEFTAASVARLPQDALHRFLDDNSTLPPEVLLAIIGAHGRSSTTMKLIARRGDLDDTVAVKLAGRSATVILETLRGNLTVPAAAYWKVSRSVRHLDASRSRYDGNQFARAFLVTNALRTIGRLLCGTEPPSTNSFAARMYAEDMFRLLPVDHIDADVRAGLAAYGPSSSELSYWSIRRPRGDAARVFVSLAVGLPETTGSGRIRDHLSEPVDSHVGEHRVWSDDTSVDAAWHVGGRWRQLALASPALDRTLIWATLRSADDQFELGALALNPALDTAMVAVLLDRLDPKRRFHLHQAPLTDTQRRALLTGDGAELMAGTIAEALTAPARPGWLDAWWTVELAHAALVAAGDDVDVASPILEAMVATWPDTLDVALATVTVHHRVGKVIVAALAERLGHLDATGAAVVATMLSSWDGALDDLVSVAALI